MKSEMQIVQLELSELHADDSFNCRGTISRINVTHLAQSMRDQGLQNPITVQPYSAEMQIQTGKKYRIVCGHRRFRAAEILEWESIPCIVREGLSEIDARLLNLGENLDREELNIVQESNAVRSLYLAGLGQEEIAKRLHQSRSWVQVRFYLLTLPDAIQQEAAAGILTQTQIREIYSLPDEESKMQAVRTIKDARLKGEKPPKKVAKPKKYNPSERKLRERVEIFAMMSHIQDIIGNNFGTRCLAWTAGEISDLDLYLDLRDLALEAGMNYEIPKENLSTVS